MTPPPLDPSDQDAAPYKEGDAVTVSILGPDRPLQGVIEHVYDDGGHRIKAGPALWVYLPPASTHLSIAIPDLDEELSE